MPANLILMLLPTLLVCLLAAEAASASVPGQPFAGIEDLYSKVSVSDIIKLKDGRLFIAYSPDYMGAYSTDGGKTWGEPFAMRDEDGKPVSPALGGLIESKPEVIGFSEWVDSYTFGWRRSTDAGKTWSKSIPINQVQRPAVNPHANPRPFMQFLQEMVWGIDRGSATEKGRIILPFAMALPGPISPEPGQPVGWDAEETLFFSFLVYSDDGGLTWNYSKQMIFILLDGKYPADHKRYMTERGKGGFYQFEEPTALELGNGDIMMMGRSTLGRSFAAFSKDGGVNWGQPEPLPIASPDAPSLLKKLPNGDYLLIWNQTSPEENIRGYSRHRLSTAISRGDGKQWRYHRNLESLDDVAYIEPPAVKDLHSVYGPHYDQPKDRKRYVHAPGSLRTCYPSARVLDDVVIVSYNYGCPSPETPDMKVGTKTKVLPFGWFYGK
jgi:hypothetical protein